jgi:hypothetical protein
MHGLSRNQEDVQFGGSLRGLAWCPVMHGRWEYYIWVPQDACVEDYVVDFEVGDHGELTDEFLEWFSLIPIFNPNEDGSLKEDIVPQCSAQTKCHRYTSGIVHGRSPPVPTAAMHELQKAPAPWR